MQITPQAVSRAVNASYEKFKHFRTARGRFLNQFAGRFYSKLTPGDREDRKASPLNLLHNAVTTVVPNLVYRDPKTKVRSNTLLYRDYAELLALGTNYLANRIGLRHTLRLVIYDAIFMAGFVKTGIATADEFVTIDGIDFEVGQPYAERVDPDDMILDPMAKSWDEQSFIGNRFRANLDDMIASGLYDEAELEKLTNRYEQNKTGEAEKLTGTQDIALKYREVERYVDLVEVYIPRQQLVVTLPWTNEGVADSFLRVAEYNGPDTGPYHMLGFTPVGDNLMPVAPAAIWYDLHIMGNRIARKLGRQAERLKRNLVYEGKAAEDVAEIAEADDGETVRVDDINAIKEITFGGADDKAYEWMEWVKRQFSEQAGSIDLLSGISTNTPTATQAEMLQANTSVRLSDMQNQVYDFTEKVVRDLAFYLHTDPLIQLPLVQRQGGQEVQVTYTPEMRRGQFFDYTFGVEPYSMARPDPNMAVRRKIEFMTNVIPAVAQAAMLLGPGFNAGAALKDIARDVQLDEADEWLNDPLIQQWVLQKMVAMQAVGDPGKAGGAAPPAPAAPMGMMGFNPGQPNPTAMGPDGGISPGTEQAAAQQESAAELQRGGNEPSARAMAMAR